MSSRVARPQSSRPRHAPPQADSGMLVTMSRANTLRDEAVGLPTLEHVFRWAIRQEPRLEPFDVVIQDEYTHDVLFRAEDKSFLVFDAT